LESGAQIGDDWRDQGDPSVTSAIDLSPRSDTIVSGSTDGKVRLWDVETGKVITRWVGHTSCVESVCWSADGERVVSGSRDATARVWDVETGDSVLAPIKTGHIVVYAAMYSPDDTKIATGGIDENAVKIWDAKTGELLSTLKHNQAAVVKSLAWVSDGKKIISGTALGSIRIFDTATWNQIAILMGHTKSVFAMSISRNDRLLASASNDKTVRLWNLDTNLPVSWTRLQHEDHVICAAFSADGTLLVTGCSDNNVYVWDIYTILKEAGLEDLLPISDVSLNLIALWEKIISSQVATKKSSTEVCDVFLFFNDCNLSVLGV
jgi:WD40 repeat protein